MHTQNRHVTEAIKTAQKISGLAPKQYPAIIVGPEFVEYHGVQVKLPAAFDRFEPVAVDAKQMLEAIKAAGKPTEEARLEATPDAVRYGPVTIPTVPTDEVPRMDIHPCKAGAAVIDVDRLAAVAVAASSDDMRPVLTSVQVGPEGACATDSYRLHVDESVTSPEEVKIPKAVCKELARVKATSLTVAPFENRADRYNGCATTKIGNVIVWTLPMVDGQFPKYQQLFPDSYEFSARLEEGAAASVKNAGRMAERNRPVVLEGSPQGIAVTMDNSSIEGAKVDPVQIASGTIPTVTITKDKRTDGLPAAEVEEPFKIGANHEFLHDGIVFGGPDAEISFISALRPMCITSQDGRRALVMPVRLNS